MFSVHHRDRYFTTYLQFKFNEAYMLIPDINPMFSMFSVGQLANDECFLRVRPCLGFYTQSGLPQVRLSWRSRVLFICFRLHERLCFVVRSD